MISEQLTELLNHEIGLEFGAHLQYLAIAVYFEQNGMDRLAGFFYAQAEEEKDHGLMILQYLSEMDAEVHIPPIPEVRQDFGNPHECAQLFLEQETHVTEQFYKMNKQALEDGDYITENFLKWFITEQREEITTAKKLLDLINMAGDNLLMVEMMVPDLEAAMGEGPDAPAE